MKIRTIGIAAAFVLASGAATAGTAGKEAAPAEKPKFEHLDDHDIGYIERKEAADMSAVSKSFEDADADGDGKLNRKEFGKLTDR